MCTQCWQCLSIVYLHPVSCVPNVDIVSRVFIFILYLVCPMLTLSLDCLSSSCILCTQCWQRLSIVCLHPVSCVPNVDSVSRLFIFILILCAQCWHCLSDCLSSSCILCTQCWQCLSIVYLHPVSCVPMLTVSLDCLSSSCILCAQWWYCLSIVFLHPVSCVPNVDSVSRLFIFILYLMYPMLTVSLDCLSSSCILCAQCWHCLSSVYLHPVSCVPNVDSVSRLFIFILYLVYPMLTVSLDCLSSSCILCAQCWHCLSSVYLHPVSCVPNVDIVSRVFIFILYLVCPMLTVSLDYLSSSCILCAQCWHCLSVFIFILYLVCPMLTLSLDWLSSSCILCTQCWQCLSIVYLHPVSCVPMLTVSLDCISSSCILCAQCWQCLSIVDLHPVSYVPNVDIVSRLFIFILYLVCPMLTLSLECLSSSCILCAQCWQCLSIVYLHPVSCVPNVDIVSRLLSSSCILCTHCWQCLSIVYLNPVSCVPNVDSVSRVFIFILYLVSQCWHCLSMVCLHPVSCVPNVDSVSRLFVFILYLVYPMLTLSLDCLSSSCILCTQCWQCLSIVYLHPVSCVPNVDIVSRVFIFILYLVCPMLTLSLDCLSSSCILCTQCWQRLSIVCLHPVSCVPNVDIVSRLFIFILYLVCPMLTLSLECLSSSCILCAQCWHCLSIVYLHPVSCVPNVDSVSRLFIFILYLVYPMLTLSLDCLFSSLYLVYPMLTASLDCLSSSCIFCTQCWQCLSIIYLHPVSCVPNVDIVSRLFIFILYLVYPMLTVSLDCLSSSCILCAQCWHCLSSVYLHPVSCVPNVDSVSRLFIFILYLVYPMLTVSIDCLSSSCILCA